MISHISFTPFLKIMRNLLVLLFAAFSLCAIQSCSIFQETPKPQYVSVINDLNHQFLGKSKGYIIENFPFSPTDIKKFDDQYETLIFERHRYVGPGITKFHLKNGVCYKIETNEYKQK